MSAIPMKSVPSNMDWPMSIHRCSSCWGIPSVARLPPSPMPCRATGNPWNAISPGWSTTLSRQGDAVIDHAIRENVWQGIEDLFMKSPVTRQMVKGGTVKVVGAIYDVASGKVTWLPDVKVAEILEKVETSSEKETEVFAAY